MTLLNIEDDDATPAATSIDSAPAPSGDGPSHITIELECDLTDAELQDRGEQMAADERAVERLKLRRKALNADIRGKLDHMTVLAIAIDSRKESREVQCTWRPDYDRKQWDLTRDDTERVIRTRAMSKLDLQTKLPLDSAPQLEAAADAEDDDDEGTGDPDDDGSETYGDVEPDPAYLDDPLDAPFEAPANDNVRLLPARSTPEDAAVMARHTKPKPRNTKPATPASKRKSSKANGRKAR